MGFTPAAYRREHACAVRVDATSPPAPQFDRLIAGSELRPVHERFLADGGSAFRDSNVPAVGKAPE